MVWTVKLKKYPSGLLGSAEQHQVEPATLSSIRSQLASGNSLLKDASKTGNPQFNDLMQAYRTNALKNSFELFDQTILAGIDAFGTKTLAEWISAQEAEGGMTEYASMWIEDTIMLVTDRKTRRLTPATARVIIGNGVRNKRISDSPVMVKAIGKYGHLNKISIAEFVLMWANVDAGDLLSGLEVMFGQR
jgi:hypothetical protein